MSATLDRINLALNGRYSIGREIGRGGMATVLLGVDLKHQRDVAVKVFRPEVAAVLGHDRFQREIDLLAQLSHPHILPLHDSGDADGLLFYVMPFVKGETLRQAIEREGRMPVERAVDLVRQLSGALEYAHARHVVHRDIKPENILLHEGVAVLADFGIALTTASPADERLTGIGISLGTPEYMSPEQALAERELDARSDVYSLACVLFELLAGAPPFTGPSALSVTAKKLTEPAPDVRGLRPDVPSTISRALARALAREPHDRYASITAFSEALGAATPVSTPVVSTKSVAVLPFINLSADPENEYFADGITADIIAQLSKIRALKVISRSSVMRYKTRDQSLREIAARLGVAALVDGSVRRIGDRVRIVAELIDAETDRHLWADTYDRQLTDVFAIQSDVALRIAAALQAELTADERTRIHREPTQDVQAYQLYLQGRAQLLRYNADGLRKSIWYFDRAIRLDPEYALPYAGIAYAYAEIGETGLASADEVYPRARDAAAAALERDPDLAEAHLVLGMLEGLFEYDWTGAEQEFRRALELNPSSADCYDLYGRMCSALGRHEEALELQRRAQQLDPIAHRSDHANELLRAGRYDEALEEARRGVDLDPDYDRLRATLGWALMRTGRMEEGIAQLERAVALSPESSAWLAQLGQAYGEAGEPAKAREVIDRLDEMAARRYVSPYHMAYVYTGLGDHERALDWLEKAYEQRSGAIYGIKGSFLFTSLRDEPRFIALMRRMNLVQ